MAGIHLNPHGQKSASLSSAKTTRSQTGARCTVSSADGKAQRLAKACADFEAIFVEQLFKTMRASVPESELLDGGRAEEIYTAMLDQQIAQEMALGQGSLGLAHQMRCKLEERGLGKTVVEMKDR